MDAPPAMIVPGQMNVSATGAFTYTIPIAVPPGTAGMVPALSLDYSSQNGDGIVGLGWSLSGLPSISRCPRTLAQDGIHGGVNYDANDRFCMEGQRLVAITGTYGADGTEYRTEIEGFSKIVSHGVAGSGPAWFEVHTKSGQIMEFGNTADSKGVIVPAPCSLVHPGVCSTTGPSGTVRVWAVSKISDTVGNYLTVTYDNGTPDTVNGQVYPTRIDYTGNAAAALTPYNSVRFVYTTRNDQVPVYQNGAVSTTTVLLNNVQTYAGTALVSDYRLAYTAAASAADVDKLASVTLCDGSATPVCLAPTTFDWQGGTVSQPTASPATLAQGQTVHKPNSIGADYMGDGLTDATVLLNGSVLCPSTSPQSINYGAGNGTTFNPSGITVDYGTHANAKNCNGTSTFYVLNTFLLDLDGDGIMDALEADYNSTSNYNVLRNDGAGHMTSSQYVNISNPNGIHIGDFDGDGRSDIYSQQRQADLQSQGNGFFAWDPINTGLDPDPSMSILLDGDFNGDGCTDLLTQGNQAKLYYFCKPLTQLVIGINGYTHDGYTPTVADFNGDGKADILWTKWGAAGILWLSTGTSFIEVNTGLTGFNCDCYVFTGDWNGDGKADVARTPTKSPGGNIEIFLSTGTGFVDAGTFGTISDPGDYAIHATAVDWNNDGGPDLWVQLGLATSGDTEYLFAFKPILMTTVHNGIGSTIAVTYDRLNKNGPLYTKCPSNPATDVCGDAYPTQDIDGPLYVVSRIDSSNGIGGTYGSTYAYAGAKADLKGRGFLGFSSVSIDDLQTSVVQTTNYRTDFPYVGLVASQTKTHGTVTLNSTTDTYGDTSPGTNTDGVGRHFVSLTQSIASANDLDSTALPTTTTAYTYDAFGNALTVNVAVSDGSSKNTTNTYSNDTTNWFLGRLTDTTVTSTVPDTSPTVVNRPPVAANDNVSTYQNVPVTFDPRTNDSDPDGDPLTVSAVTVPLHGTASFTTTSITYTPASGYYGSDSFNYTIADGHGHTATATVSMSVINRPPTAVADSLSYSRTIPVGGSACPVVTIDPRVNDSDPDGDPLTVVAVTAATQGTVTFSSGTVTYTYPCVNQDTFVTDSFTYTISDGHGHTASATESVSIRVTSLN